MSQKKVIWWGMVIGSAIGGLIPGLWGADTFSMSGVLFTALGGFSGIWIGYTISR